MHRLSALAVCPKNCNFRRWMSFRSRVSSPISSRMDWFVRCCSFQLIRNMRRYDVISKALILFLSLYYIARIKYRQMRSLHSNKKRFSLCPNGCSDCRCSRRSAGRQTAPYFGSGDCRVSRAKCCTIKYPKRWSLLAAARRAIVTAR